MSPVRRLVFTVPKHVRNAPSVACARVDVAMVRWPGEAFRRSELAERGLPRLLLIAPEEPVPPIDPMLEDWARVPVGDEEIAARRTTLRRRCELHDVTN